METESDFLVEESLLLYSILVVFMPWARWLVCNLSLYGFCDMLVCVRFVWQNWHWDSFSSGTVIILQCYIFIFILILPLS